MPNYDPDHEKWIDLDGTGHFYLRLIYGKVNPITEFNFFYISSKMEHKIQIPEFLLNVGQEYEKALNNIKLVPLSLIDKKLKYKR